MKSRIFTDGADLSRRRFVQGLVGGGTIAATGLWAPRLRAGNMPSGGRQVLRGTEFHLNIGYTRVNFTGRERLATTVNGQIPAPELRWREGDCVRLHVTNHLDEPTSIHWHGIILPYQMDGVPGLSFPGIAPGETFTYEFDVKQNGTYWYHSHSGFQEQTGMYGPLVIEPRNADPVAYDREHVVLLSDWTDEDPYRLFANLKAMPDYYNRQQRTVSDFFDDVARMGFAQAFEQRRMWGEMRMKSTDIADVTGVTYTYLMNGQPPAANWTGLFRPGERVRLRFINGSAMTFFDVRIPGLKMTVVQADGQNVEPVTVEEFRIGVAETYDVVVEPESDMAYTIYAQAMDRSGYACGTLAVREGLRAPVPALDPPLELSMEDAGMWDHAGHGEAHGSGHAMHQGHGGHHGHHGQSGSPDTLPAWREGWPEPPPLGPQMEMRVTRPRRLLDDPGIGLRDNGRRVLTYADLRALTPGPDPREPERDVVLHLSGNMERYIWGFDGEKFAQAEPLRFRYGERLRIVLVNNTMMTHPIHLHGLWSELETGDGEYRPFKHTVNVKPGEVLSYRVSADAIGNWAYHCHLLYHMEAGMFRKVVVS